MTIARRPLTAVLCDLDDCLYECPEMQHAVAANIRCYMAERLGVPADEVAEKCAEYYVSAGCGCRGGWACGSRWGTRSRVRRSRAGLAGDLLLPLAAAAACPLAAQLRHHAGGAGGARLHSGL